MNHIPPLVRVDASNTRLSQCLWCSIPRVGDGGFGKCRDGVQDCSRQDGVDGALIPHARGLDGRMFDERKEKSPLYSPALGDVPQLVGRQMRIRLAGIFELEVIAVGKLHNEFVTVGVLRCQAAGDEQTLLAFMGGRRHHGVVAKATAGIETGEDRGDALHPVRRPEFVTVLRSS
jgi:hypothetical protein